MTRLRITTTQGLEFVRGRKVAPGTVLLDAEVEAEIDVPTLRVLLAQGSSMLSYEVIRDAAPAELPVHGGHGRPASRRTPRRASVDA